MVCKGCKRKLYQLYTHKLNTKFILKGKVIVRTTPILKPYMEWTLSKLEREFKREPGYKLTLIDGDLKDKKIEL